MYCHGILHPGFDTHIRGRFIFCHQEISASCTLILDPFTWPNGSSNGTESHLDESNTVLARRMCERQYLACMEFPGRLRCGWCDWYQSRWCRAPVVCGYSVAVVPHHAAIPRVKLWYANITDQRHFVIIVGYVISLSGVGYGRSFQQQRAKSPPEFRHV